MLILRDVGFQPFEDLKLSLLGLEHVPMDGIDRIQYCIHSILPVLVNRLSRALELFIAEQHHQDLYVIERIISDMPQLPVDILARHKAWCIIWTCYDAQVAN